MQRHAVPRQPPDRRGVEREQQRQILVAQHRALAVSLVRQPSPTQRRPALFVQHRRVVCVHERQPRRHAEKIATAG